VNAKRLAVDFGAKLFVNDCAVGKLRVHGYGDGSLIACSRHRQQRDSSLRLPGRRGMTAPVTATSVGNAPLGARKAGDAS